MGLPSSPLPGFSGSQKVLRPRSFISASVRRAAVAVPPVDHPDAVEAAVRALLQLGDVLVVDAEAQLPDVLVGPAHQPEQRVGEGQLAVDAVGLELAQARVDVVGARARQRVVLHQHRGELPRQEGLPADGERPGAVVVDDPRAPGPSSTPGTARRRCPRRARCGRRRRTPRCRPAARPSRWRVPWRSFGGTEPLRRIGERAVPASSCDRDPPRAAWSQNTLTSKHPSTHTGRHRVGG